MRTLRGALAATLLAPLLGLGLVLSLPGVAEAVIKYGPVVRGTVAAANGSVGEALSCAIGAAYKVTPTTEAIVFSADCDRNPQLAASMSGGFNVSIDGSMTFNGTQPANANLACGMTGTWSGPYEPSGQVTTATNDPGCAINQVCLTWTMHAKFWPDAGPYTGCSTLNMGAPPTPVEGPATCAEGTFPGAYFEVNVTPGDGYTYEQGHVQHTHTAGGAPAGTAYRVYIVEKRISDGALAYLGNDGGNFNNPPGDIVKRDGAFETWPDSGYTVVGVGVWAVTLDGQPTNLSGTPMSAVDPLGGTGAIGRTDPAKCTFYWGEKIVNNPLSTMDEPKGALATGPVTSPTDDPAPDTADPSPSGDGCGFSITDPSSWASGGICQLVGLVRDLIRAIGKLPADIASAIMTGLSNLLQLLFVPEDVPSFSDIPSPLPAGWVPSFPSLTDGSCGTVSLPQVDLGNMLGEVGPTKLFDSCEDPWPIIRTLTYNGILALVLLTCGFAAYNAISKALGIDIDGGSGGDDS